MPRKDLVSRAAYEKERGAIRRAAGYKPPSTKLAQDRVNAIKEATPCADCGLKFPPICMDFDHVEDKRADVSRMLIGGYTWGEIQSEMARCEIVCANCHRLRTHFRQWVYGHPKVLKRNKLLRELERDARSHSK